jgi:fatty acid desaturase
MAAAIAAAIGVYCGNILVTLLAAGYIGVRQRHLSNLGHECVHAKIARSPRAGKFLGYLITALLGEGFEPYQVSHRIHHARLGRQGDPMLESYVARSVSARTPSRTSFIMRVIALKACWALPKSAVVTFFSKPPSESWRSASGRAASWVLLVALCARTGTLTDLAAYWLAPLILVRPTVTWITDLGNHAGVIGSEDPITQTRGWTSHWLTRHILGGHYDDMYHPVHHWFPRLPWRKLPAAAEVLQAGYGRWQEVPWCSGFFFRRRVTPEIPCVIEDIIARLRPGDDHGIVPARGCGGRSLK